MLASQVDSREAFLRRVRALLPALQENAAALDQDVLFPANDIAALRDVGLLTATLPCALGGLGFGEDSPGAQGLFRLLYTLGEGNLAVARVYEAHVNALQLILRYGTRLQGEAAARDASEGALFALWVTDPPTGAARLEGNVLQGGKAFCSAAGFATRALITAGTPDGAQMLVVRLAPGARVLPSKIKLAGMRAAVTGSMDFTGMAVEPEQILGQPETYLREPVFSAGAWRSAAAALGGLAALIKIYRDELRARGRGEDPHQRARFGKVVMAHETARLWMEQAALRGCLEDGPSAAIVAYINLARMAVEAACLDAMRDIQRSLGLSAFMAGHKAERLCRDLATYLRQPAPDETLDKAAGHYFTAPLPGDL